MEGLWIQTKRGLEPLNGLFLAGFLKKHVPKLRPKALQDLSQALEELLNTQSLPSAPFNLATLAIEVRHLLIQLEQVELASYFGESLDPDPLKPSLFGAFGDAIDAGLFAIEGDPQRPYLMRWDLVRNGLPEVKAKIVVLEVPDPRIKSEGFDLWLARTKAFLNKTKSQVWFLWTLVESGEISLFHPVETPCSAEGFASFLDLLKEHAGPRIRLLASSSKGDELGLLGGPVPEGILVGSMDPVFSGKGLQLVSRVEIHLQHLARMRADSQAWITREAANLRKLGAKTSGQTNPLAPTVRWVLRGWLDPRGATLLEPVWETLQNLWPACDEMVLGWEKGLPTEPMEMARFHDKHPILARLEEIRHPLLWPQPAEWAHLRQLGFKGPIWQTGF